MATPPDFTVPLEGRVILVTGGASGIGLATVRTALASGAWVAAVDIDRDGLAALRDGTGETGARLMTEVMDVTDGGGVAAGLAAVNEAFGPVDGLVCSAGISVEAPLLEVTPELWERHIALNLTGSFNVAQAVARGLVEAARPGAIVMVSSAQGFRGRQNSAAYVSSKAGIFGLTKAMALDLAEHDIRVNCVAPGAVETPLMHSVVARTPGGIEAARARIPLGRIGQPEDLAAPICFLLSDAASWITGQTLHVNGGSLLV